MFMVPVRGRLENNFANVSFDYRMNLFLDLSISNCLLCRMQIRLFRLDGGNPKCELKI